MGLLLLLSAIDFVLIVVLSIRRDCVEGDTD